MGGGGYWLDNVLKLATEPCRIGVPSGGGGGYMAQIDPPRRADRFVHVLGKWYFQKLFCGRQNLSVASVLLPGPLSQTPQVGGCTIAVQGPT